MNIICPYCFKKMEDSDVHFRSERFCRGESDALPDEYDDIDDFKARYNGTDKEEILRQLQEWEFFSEGEDPVYMEWWKKFNVTTESNPTDDFFGIKAYKRKVIEPNNERHKRYLKSVNGDYLIRDRDGMVTQIELTTGEKCSRRVCCECHNPLPGGYGKNEVKFVTILGITGSGKTVYISQLLKNMANYVAKVGLSATVSNTEVRSFIEKNQVAKGKKLPNSTARGRFEQPLFYEIDRRINDREKKSYTFVLYDVAGEAFAHRDQSVENFAPFITHADGVIVLIDPCQLSEFCENENANVPITVLEAVHNLIQASDGIEENTKRNTNEMSSIPFAICISKADEVHASLSERLRNLLRDDVKGEYDGRYVRTSFNAREYNPIAEEIENLLQRGEQALINQMRNNYQTYAYFMLTALGCSVNENQCPEGPIMPKRIEEPLLWLFYQLGFIETNGPVYSGIKCAKCQSLNVVSLKEVDRIRKGLFRWESVNRACTDCGHRWWM